MDTTFSNCLADAVPLRWSMWSPCSNNCWKNGEKRPRRNRTQYCDIDGVIDTCNENFEECGYPCKFGRLIKMYKNLISHFGLMFYIYHI